MRLWHYKMLPYLPNSQLLAQKRECDLIWKDINEGNKTNHILINYIWEYEDYERQLSIYYAHLKKEFRKRSFNFKESKNAVIWCGKELPIPFIKHHNNTYLFICHMNLLEKCMRGQKDFSITNTYIPLYNMVNKELHGFLEEMEERL